MTQNSISRDPPASAVFVIVVALAGAAFSVLTSGFVFGYSNNIFHLAIFEALYDEPQFRDDAFIQSLRYYSSGVWIALRGAGEYLNAYWTFFFLFYLSRFLSFAGLLLCATLINIDTRKRVLIFASLVCFTSMLRGYSAAGRSDLFNNYFSHTSLANGTTLLLIYFALRHRYTEAILMNGVTFFANAFVAVWNIVSLGLMMAISAARREVQPRTLSYRIAIGTVLLVPICLPVLINVTTNPEFGKPVGFDYRGFLAYYAPSHFFVTWAPAKEVALLLIITAIGFLSLLQLGSCAFGLVVALLGYVLVYVVGITIPIFVDLPILLNLHLLRAGALIHFISAVGCIALTTTWLCSSNKTQARVLGPVMAIAITSLPLLPIGIAVILAARVIHRFDHRIPSLRLDYLAAVVLLAFVWPRQVWVNMKYSADVRRPIENWATVGRWARTKTPESSVFLLPTETGPDANEVGNENVRKSAMASVGSESFDYASHRRVWVDHKRGAAVMWMPSYYRMWRRRMSEVVRLSSVSEKLTYARKHGINYVIDACTIPANLAPVFRSDRLCVFSVSTAPESRSLQQSRSP